MNILFLALTIYLTGTAVVLYLRPSLMFHKGGAWKEFSLNPGPNHTYMPFWLFTIMWALFSYLLAGFLQRFFISRGADDEPGYMDDYEDDAPPPIELGDKDDFEEIAKPISKALGSSGPSTAKNGFYVLDTSGEAPIYVYYGDKPPTIGRE